ncbi:MAG: glycosidase [Rhizobacter sp.]|nr:glycosidase [Rhizobacter sp.]
MKTPLRTIVGSLFLSLFLSVTLAGCGGGSGGSDMASASAAGAGTGTDSAEQRMTALAVTGTTDTSSLTLCASENGVCSFLGTRVVRYGTATQYVETTVSMSTACNNAVFGDPAPNIYKSCWYGATNLAAVATVASVTTTSTAITWTACASENGRCTFTGLRNVRYGAGTSLVTQLLASPAACSNATFGDPIPGVVKACSVSSEQPWLDCAKEGAVCVFDGLRDVRYGTAKNAVVKQFVGKTDCSNAVFGDPEVSTAKSCWVAPQKAVAKLGVYLGAECKGAALMAGYTTWLGRKPDRALEFLSNETWLLMENASSRSPACWASTGLPMTFSVSMLPADGVSTLVAGARGDYDAHFKTIAANFVAAGQANAVVRLGWEFNFGWYPWAASPNPTAWVAYWRRIVTAMRSVPGQSFRFDWTPAIGQGDIAAELVYPGDAYVDIVGLDVYNQTWMVPVPTAADLWTSFQTQAYGLNWHRDFALAHGKAMSYPEWGTGTRPDGHGLGDDPVFIANMAAWIAANNVTYHDYWDYEAPDYNAKLSTGNYPQAAAAFKAAFAR